LALGERLGQCGGQWLADAGGQAILFRFDELPHDAFDPLDRLAFAEDDFGETTAFAAVQVDVGKAKVGYWRRTKASERRLDSSSSSRKSAGSMCHSGLPG
jgi:hypothetical protein